MNFFCVYRSGRDFTLAYVLRLNKMISAHYNKARLYCLSDVSAVSAICNHIPLKHNWPGWWSKIELFRPDLPKGPCIYFDLDTVIVDELDTICELVEFSNIPFLMLRGFNKRLGDNPASGVMAASNGFSIYSEVYNKFLADPEKAIKETKKKAMDMFPGSKGGGQQGDQGWISSVIGYGNIPKLQTYLPPGYIVGKRDTRRGNYVPIECSIISWSGRPRLHKQNTLLSQEWRKYA